MNPEWKKVGWRSVQHRGYPKMVVRFGPDGKGKGKLLCDANEFVRREVAAGRASDQTFGKLVADAEKAWPELRDGK